MGALLKFEREFSEIERGECGIIFHVPMRWHRGRRENGNGFYCPNGHYLAYKQSEVDKLKAELEQERNRVAFYRREAEQRRTEAVKVKKKLATTQKRVSGGACPCCNRHFVKLQQHMTTKHPGYAERD